MRSETFLVEEVREIRDLEKKERDGKRCTCEETLCRFDNAIVEGRGFGHQIGTREGRESRRKGNDHAVPGFFLCHGFNRNLGWAGLLLDGPNDAGLTKMIFIWI